jgi:hypothetical protein
MRKPKKEICPIRSKLGRRSRTKGHSFERWCANQLRKIFPDCRRHLEYQDAEANGVDLVNTGNYDVQCKRGKKYASIKDIEQCNNWGIPILITKGDNKPPMVVMDFNCFLRLLRLEKKYYGAKLE